MSCRTALLGGALLFLHCSCGTKGPPLPEGAVTGVVQQEVDLLWPSPPETPRIRYLRSISGSSDLGIEKSFWRRFREFFVGKEREERIVKPYGVETDSEGRIYVVDSFERLVHVFDMERRRYQKIGDRRELEFPIDLAIDARGQIFVSDADRGLVLKYDSKGRLIGEIGGGGDLTRPTGIAYSAAKDLIYVVDVSRHHVVVFDPGGIVRRRFGRRGVGDGEFNFPTNITVDRSGRIYVTDSLNFRIQTFDAEEKFISSFGRLGDSVGDFSKPKGIAVDGDGHIYVVEGLYDTVLIYDQQGRLLLNFGSAGTDHGQFWLATGIFIDSRDRIYVADSYNHRIQVFQYLQSGS